MTRRQFSRRDLLRAAGSTLTLPLFLQRAFADERPRPPNLVLLMQTNGTNQENYWPSGDGFDSPILHDLLSNPALASKTTLLKNVHLDLTGEPDGNPHDQGFHGLFSGFAGRGQGTPDVFPGGASLDHVVARSAELGRPIDKIHCGVHAANYQIINAGRASFSATGPMQVAPCELDLYKLYRKVFGEPIDESPAARAAAAQRFRERKSVLDAVAGDLQTLQNRLGPGERSKVDLHLTAVRDFEKRLADNAAPPPVCSTIRPSRTDVPSEGQGNEANAEPLLRLFMEFMANAIACDMVGVLSFQFGRGGEHFHYDWLNIPGMPEDAHDFVAHLDDGSDPNITRISVGIKRWYTELVTDLATRLDAFPRGEGQTALDDSLIVWGNEIATGTHTLDNMPLALVGRAGGRLKRTGYLVDAGPQAHHRLGTTVLNLMGVPAEGFGLLPECGVLAGLELV